MSGVRMTEYRINKYEAFMKTIQQFEGVEACDYRRKELSGLIKKYTTEGLFT